MRIAHLTDVHFLGRPGLRALLGKRALGGLNLALGRIRAFDATDIVPAVVEDVLAARPDVAVISGDLSALSLEEEWVEALRVFEPLLNSVPTVVIPGNHDRYTNEAWSGRWMERHFGPWMGGGTWDPEARRWSPRVVADLLTTCATFELGGARIVAVDTSVPGLRATGRLAPAIAEHAIAACDLARADGRAPVLVMHYPVFDEREGTYDHAGHSLADVPAAERFILRASPTLVLHGHRHTAWRRDLSGQRGPITILNCGSSSAVSEDPRRAAGWFEVVLDSGRVERVRRRIRPEGAATFRDDLSYPGAR